MDPLTRGDYPESMKKSVKGLPVFTKAEKELIKGAFDYIGINYYTSRYVEHTCVVDAMVGTITIKYSEQKGIFYFILFLKFTLSFLIYNLLGSS